MKSFFIYAHFLFVIFIFTFSANSQALASTVQGVTVVYQDGAQFLRGYLAYDADQRGARPAVFVVHEWKGLDDYAKQRARELAAKGYLAMAVDIYGDGKLLKSTEEAAQLSSEFKANPKLLRGRMQAAYDFLKKNSLFDSKRVAAIGYCFGGTTVLEWARGGARIAGVVSFHGGLKAPEPARASQVKARVLILHGSDDPYVPDTEVAGFENEMRQARADWQLVKFGGAVHGFSRSDAGRNVKSGYAYDQKADQRSYAMMLSFFDELFN